MAEPFISQKIKKIVNVNLTTKTQKFETAVD